MTKVLRRTMLAVLTVAALLCLSLVFASGLNPAAAYAEETPVANAQSRAAVTNIGSWDGSSDGLYQLINGGGEGKLVSSVSYNGLMNVEQNTTIDLNGYSIIRTGASGDEYGSVFYVKPGITLTIKDTSSGGNGTVTGGNSTYGGGVWIGAGSTLNLLGGNISGNTAGRGGGVYLESNSTFTMSGGRVRNNTATANGGGVYSVGSGLTISISGGEITGNNASSSGGGIYIDNSTLTMSGGSVSGNTAVTIGGGIYASGTFYLRGNATVTGNTVSGAKSNIYLPSDKKVTVNGQFTGSAGIYTQVNPSGASTRPIAATASYASYLDTSRFSFDKSGNYGFLISGTSLLAVQTANISFVLPSGVTWKSGYTAPTTYIVGDGLRLPTASNLNQPADTADTAYVLSLWYANSAFTSTRYSQISSSETGSFTLYAKLSALTKIKLDTAAQTFTYDGQPHAYALTGTNADLTGYTVEYSSDGGNTYAATAPIDVGTYYVRIQRSSDNTYADYYEVISNAVVIEKAALTRPTLTANMTYTYNGQLQTVSIDNLNRDVMTITGDTGTDAQNYTVQITPDGNHKWATGTENETIELSWTINKASFTPSITQSCWTYGEEMVPLVISGVLGTPAPIYHYSGTSNDGTYNETDSVTAPTVAGSYSLYLTYVENDNTYAATSNTANFTIARATFLPTVTIDGWTYGQTASAPDVTGNPSGADPAYRYTDKVTGGTIYDSAVAPTNAGEYTLGMTIGQTANYEAYSTTRDFTVAQAALTVTIADKTSVYGDAQVGLTAQITSGTLVSGDADPWSLDCSVTVTTGIGTYDITGTPTNDNYRITFAGNATSGTAGVYTVTARAITVTIADKTGVYGDAQVNLTASVTTGELKNGDADPWTLDCNVDGTTNVGAYDITGTATNANYNVTFAGNATSGTAGNYTVTARAITVTITDKMSVYGDARVDLTASVTTGELKNGDADPWTLDCNVDGTTNVGAYDISGTPTNDNYRITFAGNATSGTAGVYTVTARAIVVTIADKTSVYGDARVDLTASVTTGELKNGDADPWTLDCNVDGTTNVGSYEITGTATNANYNVTFAGNATTGTAGVYTVTARALIVTIADKTSIYGDARVDLTASITSGELKNNDADPWTLASDVDGTTSVGAYDITGTGTNDNYDVTFAGASTSGTAGIYTVTARPITVTIADKMSVYGDTPVPTTSQIKDGSLGLVNNDANPWTLACSVTAQSDVNTYEITGTANNPNYAVTFEGETSGDKGVYTVTKRAITVTITAKSSVYGNAHAELSGEVTSDNKIVNGDIDVYSLFCDVTATSAVGKYDITGTGTDNNYNVTFEKETQSYEVTNADITEVSATGYEGTFDKGAHDAVNAKGQTTVNDQTATWKYKTTADGEYASDMPRFTNAGTYAVWYEVTAPNHNAYTGSFTVTIAKADYDMSGVTLSDKKVNENGSAQTIVISGTLPDNVSVSYSGGNQIEPGEYTVTATFATTDNNYNAPAALTAKLTIRATEIVYEKGEGDNKEQSIIVEITNGMDPDVKLSIIDLQKDEATKVEVKRGKYGRIAQAYDVKFLKNLTVVQPDGTVTVRLLIDESMRNRNDLKVYYIDADGNVTDMNATRDGDYLVFSTTHFSTYAIAFTGLLGWEIALIVIFSIIFLLLVYALIFFLLYKKGKLPGSFWDKFYFPLRMLFGDKAVLAAAYAGSGATYQVNKVAAPAPIETDDSADETAATITNDEQDDNSDEEADEETEEVNSETGFPNIQASPFTLSYTARLIQAGDDLKKFYSAVKNELLSYRMKSSIQGSGEKFRGNKKMLGYTSITGKTLKLYLALDPATIDKTSGAKKVSAKKYEAVPCMIRVRNPLALKKTLALIKRVAEENGLAKDADYSPHDYAADFPYESIEALIAKGLAKDNRPNGGIQQ